MDAIETTTDSVFETLTADSTIEPTPVITVTRKARKTGPRGATARCAPRHDAARSMLLQLAADGTNALAVLAAGGGAYNYADIMKVAREFVESGAIVESKKGRKNTWTLPPTE